jgi:hypothetical protein
MARESEVWKGQRGLFELIAQMAVTTYYRKCAMIMWLKRQARLVLTYFTTCSKRNRLRPCIGIKLFAHLPTGTPAAGTRARVGHLM